MQDNEIMVAIDALIQLVEVSEADLNVGMVGAMMYDLSKPDTILSVGGITDFTQNVSRGKSDNEQKYTLNIQNQ